MVDVQTVQDAVADIPAFITEGAIECYHKYANLDNDMLILDIGTGWGKSLVGLALSNPTNIVESFDPGDTPIGNNWAEGKEEYASKIRNLLASKGVQNVLFSQMMLTN